MRAATAREWHLLRAAPCGRREETVRISPSGHGSPTFPARQAHVAPHSGQATATAASSFATFAGFERSAAVACGTCLAAQYFTHSRMTFTTSVVSRRSSVSRSTPSTSHHPDPLGDRLRAKPSVGSDSTLPPTTSPFGVSTVSPRSRSALSGKTTFSTASGCAARTRRAVAGADCTSSKIDAALPTAAHGSVFRPRQTAYRCCRTVAVGRPSSRRTHGRKRTTRTRSPGNNPASKDSAVSRTARRAISPVVNWPEVRANSAIASAYTAPASPRTNRPNATASPPSLSLPNVTPSNAWSACTAARNCACAALFSASTSACSTHCHTFGTRSTVDPTPALDRHSRVRNRTAFFDRPTPGASASQASSTARSSGDGSGGRDDCTAQYSSQARTLRPTATHPGEASRLGISATVSTTTRSSGAVTRTAYPRGLNWRASEPRACAPSGVSTVADWPRAVSVTCTA